MPTKASCSRGPQQSNKPHHTQKPSWTPTCIAGDNAFAGSAGNDSVGHWRAHGAAGSTVGHVGLQVLEWDKQ